MASTNSLDRYRIQNRLLKQKIEILDQMIRFQDDIIEYLRYEIRNGSPPPINFSNDDMKQIADNYAAREKQVNNALAAFDVYKDSDDDD